MKGYERRGSDDETEKRDVIITGWKNPAGDEKVRVS